MIEAQGGDPRVVSEPSRLAVAPVEVTVKAQVGGFVASVDALAIGLAAVAMGAGRERADATVDHAVGISVDAKPGVEVKAGDALARIHVHAARDAATVLERIRGAFVLTSEPKDDASPLVRGRLGA